ncbi:MULTISPECIES: hypothetical protein [Pseudomonas syringae group]|uniref:Uncharacterized protein n=3 Tax=Pseudomonas syringae group TaxID=136849 RepID=A0A0P9KU69_PSECA|nr:MULTISPECIES: hypothetical protein [Pseudomonas syringae group]KAA8706208.1 hypothetical protein F4W70_20765 [Pseudomonas cannabina]KPB75581.1 Uncharacterized protein AC507_0946 [Pseudomonas syringae pv. maculicola]KPW26567.1 Uncharacterized protein ALO83_01722 [Pseudomonas cannabina pv. alisalensis]KPW65423.1 Uncharacterized protein ALO81_00927 [Pseudomonas cannabina]MBM0141068.1 hypothetical protein [Pseudomonas cannabina pv. alisalensis]
MSIITKWALQAVALFVLGWMAAVTASWSNNVASGTGNDRLAELNSGVLTTSAVAGLSAATRVE